MTTTLQLTDYKTFNAEEIIFSKPEIGNIPGQKINFKRIRIGARYPDGNIGDLIISTPPHLMSFGLQETRDLATNQINGYSVPLCLWNRNGPSEEETQFTDAFNRICDHIKKYLLDHKEDIEKYDLDSADLKKFNPLFWKMEKGKIVENKGPMLYSKVIWNKRNNRITTIFVDEDTNQEIDPMDILNKQCYITAAIKIESVFIGNKISLQVKLFEVVFKLKETSIRGLLRPDAIKRETKVTDQQASTQVASYEYEDDDEDDEIEVEEELELTPIPVKMEDEVKPAVIEKLVTPTEDKKKTVSRARKK